MKSILNLVVVVLVIHSWLWYNSTASFTIKASDDVTVSGISSGGYFSAQMLVAFSSIIKGAGLFASGPYYCTRGVAVTIEDWMTTALSILVDQLLLAAKGFEELGLIDQMSNLRNSKVYVYSGTKDWIVWQEVVKKNALFFELAGADVHTDYGIASEHCFPTDFFGNPCDKLGSPYISNCNFFGSKHALEHIMGKQLNQKIDYKQSNIKSFNQANYNPGMTSSFGKTGYIYIPDGCQSKECPLHVAFHGWEQTIADIGLDYIKGTGFLGLAEANNIIILFPQVQKSSFYPYNPKGCWDWWGYSEIVPLPVSWTFPTNTGTQMKAIYKMIRDIQAGIFKIDTKFEFTGSELSSY